MATNQAYNNKTSKEQAKVHAMKQPVGKNGLPISTMNVPGISRKAGTPGWVSGPAKSAARKAK